jgi:hypothetical protein
MAWRGVMRKAGIAGITFHDLRGTAVTRLAVVGCTEAEISSITGHSLRDIRSILDSHYLHRDPALAESAIRKLETGRKFPNIAGPRYYYGPAPVYYGGPAPVYYGPPPGCFWQRQRVWVPGAGWTIRRVRAC